jgi:uncharacterized protein (DUF2384 family)
MGAVAKARPVSWKRARESGTALYSWRRSTGLNRETFARIANFSERTLATYEKHQKLPAPVRPQISEAVRLVKALTQIIPSEELTKWLHTPNPGFDGKKPWTLIKHGERDMLWEMIHQTHQGAFA